MKKSFIALITALSMSVLFLTGCNSQDTQDRKTANAQQAQYGARQPVPMYDWSLERHLVTQLYNARNLKAATHSVWRSDLGTIEGDCASMGFGLPYDTSLTNPLKRSGTSGSVIEQAEPNGIYASKNTAATWVMCVDDIGQLEPLYIETKVTVYPYPVTVDYDKNRVKKSGEATVVISKS